MPSFTGTLNTNAVFASLYNQIISIQVFGTGISDLDGLYSNRKVDGTLYGDSKLFISTDVLKTYGFGHSGMAYNLLTQHRPDAPVEEVLTIDQFRQIPLTLDDYLSKQAFEGEGTFAQFNSVMLSWLGKTREVYEHNKFNADLGVAISADATALGTITLTAPTGVAGYDLIKWRAQELFRVIEDSVKELKEPSRDYNDLGFLRNYSLEDFDIVVPLGVMSNVSKHDVPYLFNQDGKPGYKELHWKYFGTINAVAIAVSLGTERSLIETDYGAVHVMPGDLIPIGSAVDANVSYTPKFASRPTLASAIDIYLVHKKDYPIMSAFSVGTSFFNGQTLTTNQYLTFGHNDVLNAHLGEYACLKLTTSI